MAKEQLTIRWWVYVCCHSTREYEEGVWKERDGIV